MKAQDYNFIIYLILKFIHVSIYLFRHLYTIYEFVKSSFFLIFLRYIVTCHYVNLLRIIEERKIKIGSKNKITLNIYKYIFNVIYI